MRQKIDYMGLENSTQGICGFTSMMYALYENHPTLRARLTGALKGADRTTRLRAEIKAFLMTMKADDKQEILDAISNFTRGFPGYEGWTVDSYIARINSTVGGIDESNKDYSIAMPPIALMEYMRVMWDMIPSFVPGDGGQSRVILGVTSDLKPHPESNLVNPKQLKHYVYRGAKGKIYSWGRRFSGGMADLPQYSAIFYITTS